MLVRYEMLYQYGKGPRYEWVATAGDGRDESRLARIWEHASKSNRGPFLRYREIEA